MPKLIVLEKAQYETMAYYRTKPEYTRPTPYQPPPTPTEPVNMKPAPIKMRKVFGPAVQQHDSIKHDSEKMMPGSWKATEGAVENHRRVAPLYSHVEHLVNQHKLHNDYVATSENTVGDHLKRAKQYIESAEQNYRNKQVQPAFNDYDNGLWNLHKILEREYGSRVYKPEWHKKSIDLTKSRRFDRDMQPDPKAQASYNAYQQHGYRPYKCPNCGVTGKFYAEEQDRIAKCRGCKTNLNVVQNYHEPEGETMKALNDLVDIAKGKGKGFSAVTAVKDMSRVAFKNSDMRGRVVPNKKQKQKQTVRNHKYKDQTDY